MLYMQKKHQDTVFKIIKKYKYKFYAFGSRVKGTQKELSDLDLFYKDEIPGNIIDHIKEDFEESDLPFIVDIIDYNLCSDSFKRKIYRVKLKKQLQDNCNNILSPCGNK